MGPYFHSMSTELIEEKLQELERRLAAVEENSSQVPPKRALKELIGWAKESDLHLEAARLGAEWRAHMNHEGK